MFVIVIVGTAVIAIYIMISVICKAFFSSSNIIIVEHFKFFYPKSPFFYAFTIELCLSSYDKFLNILRSM